MAEVIGSLREDKATHGEKLVLEKLRTSLPKEFTVYVECPLHQPARSRGRGEMRRYPDFIVLTNYGVVVLEVKDWVQIERADKYGCLVRTRSGQSRRERNPVDSAREFSLLLQDELKTVPELLGDKRRLKVPWGYAVVLPNQPMSTITQLRTPWGGAYVLGLPDLEPPYASKRLRATLPFNASLKGREIELVRGVINPSIIVEAFQAEKHAFLLDAEQERIVAEPAFQIEEPTPVEEKESQAALFESTPVTEAGEEMESELLPIEEDIVLNASVRLVRGVAGSGKSLVLIRRAEYLKAKYPEWEILTLAYNNQLARSMRSQLRGSGIKAVTFHKLCSGLLQGVVDWKDPVEGAQGWINSDLECWVVAQELGAEFVSDEIQWIKEMGIPDSETYFRVQRRGRGSALQADKRSQIYSVYEAYQEWLASQDCFDWADVPHLVLQGIDDEKIDVGKYDAILIDEAQDFAPLWIAVVKRLLNPQGGLIFLADDPSQSIYRYFSWREKGIPVVGRTRWLRIPYRNTKEVHAAAYAVIKDDPVLMRNLTDQTGMLLAPDLAHAHLRSGSKPELRSYESADQELEFIRHEVSYLLKNGYDAEQIAVLGRRKPGVKRLKKALRGLDVQVATYHAYKGLEFDAVFLTQMQDCFPDGRVRDEIGLSEERRLLYMAMTRARERLTLSSTGKLPKELAELRKYVEQC